MIGCINIFLKTDCIIIKIKDEAKFSDILKELKLKLPELKKFYKDETTPINVTGKVLKSKEMDEIKDLIEKSINVKVSFDSPRNLGLHAIKKSFKKEIGISETKFFQSSLRSGQRIEFEGSIVVLGMAHAGARGNEKAIIAAHIIDSPQIRIADKIKERTREEVDMQAFSIAYIDNQEQIEME